MAWSKFKSPGQTRLEDSFIRWIQINQPDELKTWERLSRVAKLLAAKKRLGMPMELDHICPIADGGDWGSHNIIITSKAFNRRKGKKRLPPHIEQWFLNKSWTTVKVDK